MVDCAIVGCGQIAGGYDFANDQFVRTHAKAITQNEHCKLIAVCDIDSQVAKEFSTKWKIDKSYINLEAMLCENEIDLLSICTPTEFHEEMFSIACRNRVKTIWLEKPMASSKDAVLRMKELADKTGVNVWVNYFRRYDPGLQKVKQLIDSVGEIKHVRALYTKGLRHNGSHMLDLIHWFFGKVVAVRNPSVVEDDSFPSLSAILETERAAVQLVALDYHDYEMFELEVIGNNERIIIKDGGQSIEISKVVSSKYYDGYRNLSVNEIHDSTYGQFMSYGLASGLANKEMPGIDNEKVIQNTISMCQEQASYIF